MKVEQLAPDLEQQINKEKWFLVSEIDIPDLRQAYVTVAQMTGSVWLFTGRVADATLAS